MPEYPLPAIAAMAITETLNRHHRELNEVLREARTVAGVPDGMPVTLDMAKGVFTAQDQPVAPE